MAVPTIVSVTPNQGPSMGGMLVSIVGTNFRIPTAPARGTFTDGKLRQTAIVLFDGVAAEDVRVYSSTLITAIPPQGAPGPAIAVVVSNLDDNGAPIGGESVTAMGAFTYARGALTSEFESDLTRLIKTLILELQKQLIPEVTYATQTDYDPDTGDELHVTKFAKLPGLSLIGPDLKENRFFSLNEEPTIEDTSTLDGDGNAVDFVTTEVPYTVDVHLVVIGASDNKNELLNLQSNFVTFMHKNKKLFMDRDDSDPSKGSVSYEMDFMPDGQPHTGTGVVPNNSNIRSFSAQIVIRGFDIEAVNGLEIGETAGVPSQAIIEKGKTLDQLNLDQTVQTSVSSRVGPTPG